MLTVIWLLAILGGAVALAYVNASGRVVTAAIAVALIVAWGVHALPGWLSFVLTVAFVLLAIPLNVPTLRRKLISDGVLNVFRKVMPSMSQTERDAAPAALACDRILQAMFVPALKLARDPERGGKNFLRLLGRAYADPAPFIRKFLAAQYAEMIARFKAAFARALPDLPKKELSWRLHFIMGALSYTLAGTDALRLIAELAPSETANDELLLNRLAPFLLAGLQSPVLDLAEAARTAEHSTR